MFDPMILEASGVIVHPIIIVCIGFVAGLSSGLLGLGGGWLITPVLNIIGLPATFCVGTSLMQMVGTTAIGIYRHLRLGHLQPRLTAAFAIPIIIGVTVGKYMMVTLEDSGSADTVLRALFLSLLIFMSWRMLSKSRTSGETRLLARGPAIVIGGRSIPLLVIVVTGFGAGMMSGTLGGGGGILLVPILITVIGISGKSAVATSLSCVFLGSLYGATNYALAGRVEPWAAVLILSGSIFGSYVGASLSYYLEEAIIRRMFAALLMATALSLVLRHVGWIMGAQLAIFSAAGSLTVAVGFLAISTARKQRAANVSPR